MDDSLTREEQAEIDGVARRKLAGEITAREALAERAFIRAHYRALRQHGFRTFADDIEE